MVGVKGRSGGKATTLEEKLVKAAATAAREAKRPVPPVADPSSDDPVVRLGKPVTWGDELKRAQVEGERTQNRRREVEVKRAEVELAKAQDERDLARGKLRTKEWHDAQCVALSELFIERLSIITEAALRLLPPEQQPAGRHELERAVAEYRRQVSAATKEKS